MTQSTQTKDDIFEQIEDKELLTWATRGEALIGGAGTIVDAIGDGLAMVFGFWPYLIGVASAFAFWRLFESLEITLMLISAEFLAIYTSAKYKHVSLTDAGENARAFMPYVGAFNALYAAVLTIAEHQNITIHPYFVFAPVLSSGIGLAAYFIVKNNQLATVIEKAVLKSKGAAKVKEVDQQSAALLAKQASHNAMIQSRLTLQENAYSQLTKDRRIMELQKRAVYVTFVREMMTAAGIHPNSKEGKEILEIARKAAHGETAAQPPAAAWPTNTNGIEMIPIAEGQNPNA